MNWPTGFSRANFSFWKIIQMSNHFACVPYQSVSITDSIWWPCFTNWRHPPSRGATEFCSPSRIAERPSAVGEMWGWGLRERKCVEETCPSAGDRTFGFSRQEEGHGLLVCSIYFPLLRHLETSLPPRGPQSPHAEPWWDGGEAGCIRQDLTEMLRRETQKWRAAWAPRVKGDERCRRDLWLRGVQAAAAAAAAAAGGGRRGSLGCPSVCQSRLLAIILFSCVCLCVCVCVCVCVYVCVCVRAISPRNDALARVKFWPLWWLGADVYLYDGIKGWDLFDCLASP